MEKRKILVVDDDWAILDAIGIILENEGYSVDLLPEGKEIFNRIAHFHPDLIILDVMLGDSDGRDLCNTIKNTDHISHIPVMMISATHNIKEVIFDKCSPDDIMSKPFELENLLSKVSTRLQA